MTKEQIEIKVGDTVFARYNVSSKWRKGRIWEIDENRTLPYGFEELCTDNTHGQAGNYYPSFRVKIENINSILTN